jgi:pimeloyl-ACP methyl ester carboxylesterase
MVSTDLVVVLPGIMGSTLSKDNKLVWAPSAGAMLQAVFTLGRSLTTLQLPAGIGDAHPDDGVEPVDLMPDLHAIPGIWTPIKGYDQLLRRLRSLHKSGKIGQVLPVAYDWRLSNRYNATRLASIIHPALEQWRSSSPEREAAQLVFVCHSMGGLVARWYLEKCGGAELTRKLITLGTPYRGAARAVEQLVNGVRKGIGPLSVNLTEFARSLPSLHQLLPSYACIDHAGSLHRLDQITMPELNTAMLTDAMAFHADLAAAEAARPTSLTMTHAVVGTRQPTWTSLQINGASVEALDTIGGDNDFGDGTVPLAGAIGLDLPMDTNAVRRIVDQHGNLQANPWALDELEEVLVAKPVRRRAGAIVSVRVAVPDLILAGESLPVVVDIEADRPPAVRIEIVAESKAGEREKITASRTPKIRHGHLEASFAGLAPGAYEVRVTGLGITPVTAPVLVWTPKPNLEPDNSRS